MQFILRSTILGYFCTLVCAAAVAGRSLDGEGVTPVQKVIEMLSGMLAKGKQEKQAEEVAFASFKEFCSLTSAEKTRAIGKAADDIVELEATISKAEADSDNFGEEIAKLEKDIAGWDTEAKQSSIVREKERSEYEATHKDYSESISALERAVQTLKTASKKTVVPQTEVEASLVELRHVAVLSKVPSAARRALQSFLQEDAASKEAAPEANAYEFQSSGVIEMLEKLHERFVEERLVLEKEETNRKHSYQMVMQSLEDDTEYAKDSVSKKTAAKAQSLQEAAEAKGDLAETEAGKKADEAYLQEMTSTCGLKSREFEARQVLRTEELQAIEKAIEIISSPEVAGAAEIHLPSLLEMHARQGQPALVQLDSGALAKMPAQVRAAALLMQQANSMQNKFLASVATRVAEDPFAKVKKMIKDLLVRLMDEANEEADHKGWCDEQLATNKQSRDDLGAAVEALTSQVDGLTALIAKLGQEIAQLAGEMAEIDKAVAKATEDRKEEKAANLATLADAKVGQEAVMQAIKVLKEFYAKAADATALLQRKQTPAEDLPATWDKPYQGMKGSSTGIIGMLEVIQSDFARLEAETSAEEDQAQRDYDKFMTESEVNKAVKESEHRHKGFKKNSTEIALNNANKELKGTQEELTAALEYYDKLKPSCINTGLSYEERVTKRKDEIQSLKEALRILEGEDLSPA